MGRHPADGRDGGRHADGARRRRRPDESVVPAPLARRRLALVHLRPHAAGGTSTAGRRTAASSRWSRWRREIGVPAVGVRPVLLRLPRRRAGRRSRTAARASTTSRVRGADGVVRELDAAVHVDRVGRRPHGSDGRARRCVADGRGRGRRGRRRRSRPGARRGAAPAPRPRPAATAWFSVPEPIDFPTAGGAVAPRPATTRRPTPGFAGPPGERPPLLVMIHGGPTAAAIPALRLSVQYWTTRGFAVVDVNYRGSTGYGRAYRNLLARAVGRRRRRGLRGRGPLAGRPRAGSTRDRLCIRGGSAGGFTTLAALASGDDVRGRRQPLRRGRPRGAGPGHAQVREPLPRRAGRPVARAARRLRRALADPPPRRLRPAADRAPGPRGRGRAAEPVGDDRRRPAGPSACRWPTWRSRASSTASARPPTSAAPSTPSCRSTPRSSASSSRPHEGIEPGRHRPRVGRARRRSVAMGPPAGRLLPSGRVPDRRRCSLPGGPAGHPAHAGIHSSWPLIALELEPSVTPTFADLGVPADLVAVLDRRGITTPFPIQAATLPDALAGRDISGRAPTGSGKTLAFGLPLAAQRRPVPAPPAPRAGPRRRPASWPSRSAVSWPRCCRPSGRRVMAVYGGVGYGPQRAALDRGVDILVACPGRLEDLIAQRVVDLSDGRHRRRRRGRPHGRHGLPARGQAPARPDLVRAPDHAVLGHARRCRRRCRPPLPARAPPPRGGRRRAASPARSATCSGGPTPPAAWRWPPTSSPATSSAIVFCRTKHGADRLVRQLGRGRCVGRRHPRQPVPAAAGAGAEAVLVGRVRALVATDVAARGIHVDAVGCVVHFDPPADHKDYVHRSGRTGRAGDDGTVVTLVLPEQVRAVRLMQRALGMPDGIESPSVGVLGEPSWCRCVTSSRPPPRPRRRPAGRDRRRRGPWPQPAPVDRRPRGHRGQGARAGPGRRATAGLRSRPPRSALAHA